MAASASVGLNFRAQFVPHFRISAMHAKRHPDEEKVNRAVDGKCEWQLLPRLAWTSGPREHGVDDACETAKPQQDSSPRRGWKRFRMRRLKVCLTRPSNPLKTLRTWASAGMLHPTFKPYTDTITAPSAARPKRRNTTVCLTRPSNRWETLAPEPRQRMRNGTQMKKKLTVQWTASEWQLRPRLAWTSGLNINSCLTFVSRPCMRNGTQMKKKFTVQWTASEWQLLPRLAWTSGPREHGVDDACETAKPQQDSSPRGGPKRSTPRCA